MNTVRIHFSEHDVWDCVQCASNKIKCNVNAYCRWSLLNINERSLKHFKSFKSSNSFGIFFFSYLFLHQLRSSKVIQLQSFCLTKQLTRLVLTCIKLRVIIILRLFLAIQFLFLQRKLSSHLPLSFQSEITEAIYMVAYSSLSVSYLYFVENCEKSVYRCYVSTINIITYVNVSCAFERDDVVNIDLHLKDVFDLWFNIS